MHCCPRVYQEITKFVKEHAKQFGNLELLQRDNALPHLRLQKTPGAEEEIMRIDGLDSVEIPSTISISPSNDGTSQNNLLREKVAGMLTGIGFYEIFTNSITNSAYFDEETLSKSVKMINSLSAELDIMRPSLLPTGLEVIAHNINRKNANLSLFEFGKIYGKEADASYTEAKYLAFYTTGDIAETAWNQKARKADYYGIKATCEKVFAATGITNISYESTTDPDFEMAAAVKIKNLQIGIIGSTSDKRNKQFGIKQPVYVAHLNWDALINSIASKGLKYEEVSKFPSVQRDLALVVDKQVTYTQVEKMAASLKIAQLQSVRLFDIFESEKLGAGKKSMAVNFSFGDFNKTLTDVEIDEMVNKLIAACEKQLAAEIRK